MENVIRFLQSQRVEMVRWNYILFHCFRDNIKFIEWFLNKKGCKICNLFIYAWAVGPPKFIGKPGGISPSFITP
jgi:hypothetical protein